MSPPEASSRPLHILILSDRDWTHPQGGGTGTNLYGQVSRWLAWGHRVTLISGAYPGAERVARPAPALELHHVGSRLTVFARAAWEVLARGVGADADVLVEVINGIAFFTSLWPRLRLPRVVICHHVHQDHYVYELGATGRAAATVLERLPLRHLYRETPVLTISEAARADLVTLGVPAENIHVAYLGVEEPSFAPAGLAERPTLLYLGRLKQYKRIEVVLDVLARIPGARLEIAGEGDHEPALRDEITRRGLGDRVTLHGFVDERRKAELYDRAWVTLTASSAEGWCLTVMEAGIRGTPSVAMPVGGLPESIVDGETGYLAPGPAELAERVQQIIDSPALRARLGEAARRRARTFSWDATAAANLGVIQAAAQTAARPLRRRLWSRLIAPRHGAQAGPAA